MAKTDIFGGVKPDAGAPAEADDADIFQQLRQKLCRAGIKVPDLPDGDEDDPMEFLETLSVALDAADHAKDHFARKAETRQMSTLARRSKRRDTTDAMADRLAGRRPA